MSQVSHVHSVVPFVAGKSLPFSGQRLARVLYKPSAKTPARFPSVAVSVPYIDPDHVNANLDRLAEHISTMLENAQDGLIKSLYEGADGNLSEVTDSDISVDAIISWMNAEATGDRITRERIQFWFDSQVKDNLSVTFAEKLGNADPESAVIQGHVKIYRDVLSMLAGGKTILDKKQILGCRKAIELASSEDEIGTKLSKRLDSMETPRPIAEMLEI